MRPNQTNIILNKALFYLDRAGEKSPRRTQILLKNRTNSKRFKYSSSVSCFEDLIFKGGPAASWMVGLSVCQLTQTFQGDTNFKRAKLIGR